MSPLSEIDIMKSIDEMLLQVDDEPTRNRILKWAFDKFSSTKMPPIETSEAKPTQKKKGSGKTAGKVTYAIVANLNLIPEGKTSLDDFLKEKDPSNNQEICTCIVYYLQIKIGIKEISKDHIYTCYKHVRKEVPDINQLLSDISRHKGWLNVSNKDDVRITTNGENFIEYQLPKKKEKS